VKEQDVSGVFDRVLSKMIFNYRQTLLSSRHFNMFEKKKSGSERQQDHIQNDEQTNAIRPHQSVSLLH
jgi:hypothetical protein